MGFNPFQSFLNDIIGTANNGAHSVLSGQVLNPVQNIQNAIGTYGNFGNSQLSTLNDISAAIDPQNPHVNASPTGGAAGSGGGAATTTTTQTTTNKNGGGGGGGGGGNTTDTTGARAATLDQIGSLDRSLTNENGSAKDTLDKLLAQYAGEDAANKAVYQGQVDKNEKSRGDSISTALAAAAQGGRGLRAVLASMGALNGTGAVMADRAVAQGANADIGGANDNFTTNATNLTNAEGQLEQDQAKRKDEANTSYANSLKKNAGSIATQRQGLFQNMANFFTQSGDKSSADNWLAKMSGEDPAIEQAASTSAPNWTPVDAKFSAPSLNNYLAGNKDMTVQTAGNTSGGAPLNSPLFATTRKRETPS